MADGPQRRRGVRRLVNPRAEEVSLVDRGANEEDFHLLKRGEVMDEEIETGDEQVSKEDADTLASACWQASEALGKVHDIIAERAEEALSKRRHPRRPGKPAANPEKAIGYSDVLKGDEEHSAMADLLEAVEKAFGHYPYPFPFRRYPFPMTVGLPFPVPVPFRPRPEDEEEQENASSHRRGATRRKAELAQALKEVAAMELPEAARQKVSACLEMLEKSAPEPPEGDGAVSRKELAEVLERFGAGLVDALAAAGTE